MTKALVTAALLTGCVVPHPHVLYQAASGAALVCDVIAGVVKHCQEAPQGSPPKTEDESLTPEHQHE